MSKDNSQCNVEHQFDSSAVTDRCSASQFEGGSKDKNAIYKFECETFKRGEDLSHLDDSLYFKQLIKER
jgi:hypothetical protein